MSCTPGSAGLLTIFLHENSHGGSRFSRCVSDTARNFFLTVVTERHTSVSIFFLHLGMQSTGVYGTGVIIKEIAKLKSLEDLVRRGPGLT